MVEAPQNPPSIAIHRDRPAARATVRRYFEGGFEVTLGDRSFRHDGAIALDGSGARPWRPATFDAIEIVDLLDAAQREARVEILILGVGARSALAPLEWAYALKQCGFAFEAMPTPAACRTQRMLASDDRRVAAALLPI